MDKPDKIIEAFLELSIRKGAEAVTLHDIARRARVAYGTVRYHFNARGTSIIERSLEHVTSLAQKFVSEAILAGGPSYEKLGVVRWSNANFEWARLFPTHMSFMVYHYYRCTIDSSDRARNDRLLQIAVNRILELLYQDVGRGRIPPLVNPEDLALGLHSLVIGALFRASADPTPAALESSRRATEAAMLALLQPLTRQAG